ncbi:NUDIX domain-containing protein [Candidatus Parcubacteria bacterium]|nr:MAG: NUDIX domain-containing protein [Candidatus Parcubacteria bacterium]
MGHLNEKIDFTVCIYIIFERKILLHKHKKLHIWLPPGGHIELDEDPNEAAIREAKEETGLDVELIGESRTYPGSPYASRDLIPPRFLNRHFYDTDATHEHVNLAYFARAHSAEARHEVEGGEIRWFSKEELEGDTYDIVPDVRNHALIALAEVR